MKKGSPVTPDPLAGLNRWQHASAATHLLVSAAAGVGVGVVVTLTSSAQTGALTAWVTAASTFLVSTWASIASLDAWDTARLAQREDPTRAVRDLVLLVVAVGSLLTVALVIFRPSTSGPGRLGLGVACVVASWAVVHTVYALKYAGLYYGEPRGGLDFKQPADPDYRDFAYVAFTIGMTFQVSDTEVQQRRIRTTVLGHALISFLFSAVIIAVTINVVAGLSR